MDLKKVVISEYMKYIIPILAIMCSLASTGHSQTFPNNQPAGSPTTLISNPGAYSARAYIPMSFTDTTQANLNSYIKNYPGALIRTSSDGKYWKRDILGKKWEEFGSVAVSQRFSYPGEDQATDANRSFNWKGFRSQWDSASSIRFYDYDGAFTATNNSTFSGIYHYINADQFSTSINSYAPGSDGVFFTGVDGGKAYADMNAAFGSIITRWQLWGDSGRFRHTNGLNNKDVVNTQRSRWRFYGDSVYLLNPIVSLDTSDAKPLVITSSGQIKKASYYTGGGGGNFWSITGTSGTTPPSSFIGTTDNKTFRVRTNNNEVARFDSLGARLFLYGGTNPLFSMRQNTTLQEYQFRIGVGTGLASQAFNLYDLTSTRIMTRWNGTIMSVGNTTNPYSQSALYVWGSSNGANIDAQADSTVSDDGNIEVMDPDYSNGNGIAIQYQGRNGTGTTFGYPNRRLGQLRFNGDFNLIKVTSNNSLRFGTNGVEQMVLDSNGRVGIGTAFPTAKLHVQNADTVRINGSGISNRAITIFDSSLSIYRGNGLSTETTISIIPNHTMVFQGALNNAASIVIKPSLVGGFFAFTDATAIQESYISFVQGNDVYGSVGFNSSGNPESYLKATGGARLVLDDDSIGSDFRIANYYSASNGDVLSLIDNTTGEVGWTTPSGGGGVTTLAAIGSSPNANGATISGTTLNLEPASASFGGVTTTGPQTFAGAKTFSSNPTFSAMTAGRIIYTGTGGLASSSGNFQWDESGRTMTLTAGGLNQSAKILTGADNEGLVINTNSTTSLGPGIEMWGRTSGFSGMYIKAGDGTGEDIVFRKGDGTGTQIGIITYTGRWGVGATAPTASLHLPAGTATANTAPFKYTSGVASQTTPENGAKNFDGSNEYIAAGGVNYTLAKTLTSTATLNFDLTAVNSQDLTMTVTGASSGDAVSLSLDPASVPADVTYFGWVSAANTVTIRCSRVGGGGAADPASGTFRASVIKY